MPEEIVRRDETIRERASSIPEVFSRISWGAVWAGTVSAIGMELLLLSFGLFIAMAFINPGAANPMGAARPWSAVWYLVTMFCSLFFGGWVASRLAVNRTENSGAMHGITTWGLTSLAGLVIAMFIAGSVVTEAIGMLRTGVLAATAAPGQAGQAMGQAQRAAANIAQAAPGTLMGFFLFAWLGNIVSLVGAYFGGKAGERPPRRVGVEAEPTAPRERRAA